MQFKGGTALKTSETRKVILCLSNLAVYLISDHDRSLGMERSFPSPIPAEATFEKAFWPHAFSCHPIKYLKRITIGFGFQRLVMHFKLPDVSGQLYIQPDNENMSTFDYTYIVFTCNKRQTIELLQRLQSTVKGYAHNSNHDDTLCIDNDDKTVLDALGAALAPRPVGVILHYQILWQRWKNGERQPVRRVCVLTDDQIHLLNENYSGDGSNLIEKDEGNDGEVFMNMVDSSELIRVLEICAADEDPRLITLVIQAPSKLRRPHRWRLFCKDGESAEKLIEDVRKAVAACRY